MCCLVKLSWYESQLSFEQGASTCQKRPCGSKFLKLQFFKGVGRKAMISSILIETHKEEITDRQGLAGFFVLLVVQLALWPGEYKSQLSFEQGASACRSLTWGKFLKL